MNSIDQQAQQVSIDEVFKIVGGQQIQLRMAQSRIMELENQLAIIAKEREEEKGGKKDKK